MTKTKKIAPGHYKGTYGNVDFTVTKVDISESAWYFQLGDSEEVHDWHSTKKIAILAAQETIHEMLNGVIQ